MPHCGCCHIGCSDQVQCHPRQPINAVLDSGDGISPACPRQPTQQEPDQTCQAKPFQPTTPIDPPCIGPKHTSWQRNIQKATPLNASGEHKEAGNSSARNNRRFPQRHDGLKFQCVHGITASKVPATDESSQPSQDRSAIPRPCQASRKMPSSISPQRRVRINRRRWP